MDNADSIIINKTILNLSPLLHNIYRYIWYTVSFSLLDLIIDKNTCTLFNIENFTFLQDVIQTKTSSLQYEIDETSWHNNNDMSHSRYSIDNYMNWRGTRTITVRSNVDNQRKYASNHTYGHNNNWAFHNHNYITL